MTGWGCVLVIGWLAFACAARGGDIRDTFDREAPDAGAPNKFKIYGEEVCDTRVTRTLAVPGGRRSACIRPGRVDMLRTTLPGHGLTTTEDASGKQAACVAVDFGKEKWGFVMLHDKGKFDLRKSELSVMIHASDFSGKLGVVGFKLIDADGSDYRTPDADLFVPSDNWTEFRERVETVSAVEAIGDQPGLDLEHIVHYGIICYDRGDCENVVTFLIDDLQARTTSEDVSGRPPAGSKK